MVCTRDCLNCPFPDCIDADEEKSKYDYKTYQAEYRKKNREKLNKQQRDRYWADRKKAAAKQNAYRLKKRMESISECSYCHQEFVPPCLVVRYKYKYFCNKQCLASYLLKLECEGGKVKMVPKEVV